MSLYKLDLNGTRYKLSDEFRIAIQDRATRAYQMNEYFSCWWRVATEEDAEDSSTVHEEGDPILVIETVGETVPWRSLDQLEPQMKMNTPDTDTNSDTDDTTDIDGGNGMKLLSPDDAPTGDTSGKQADDRLYFPLSGQRFEELPQPEGVDPDKIPQKLERVNEEGQLVVWIPNNTSRTEVWSTGESIVPVDHTGKNAIEWNVQKRADQPRFDTWTEEMKQHSHTHWESIVKLYDCENIGTVKMSQELPPRKKDGGEKAAQDIGPKFGGQNWSI